jgi:hypothetical protein
MSARSTASRRTSRVRAVLAVTATVVLVAFGSAAATHAVPSGSGAQSRSAVPAEPPLEAVPRAVCGPNARPETGIQGRVSRADHESGLAAQGLQCNAELVGKHTQEKAGVDGTIVGTVGGYKVLRYKDKLGNECAYYDTSLLPPTNAGDANLGVKVLDMNDPTNPRLTTTLTSAAMISPHESLVLSEKRGLLMAVAGNLAQAVLPGIVDIYDLEGPLGCSVPVLRSSTPLGIFGHESGLAPDGNTFYSASFSTKTVVALDISNASLPVILGYIRVNSHGLSISQDGMRAYVAKDKAYVTEDGDVGEFGLGIYDISDFQNRKPNPVGREISFLSWKGISIPQSTVPITIKGKPYVLESDEFGPGASRLIDITDDRTPFVISNLRLQVHQADIRKANPSMEDDPGVNTPFAFAQDYTGHFCNVPTRVDPPIVACGMAVSGLRVFNIEDPYHPYEVAYFTAPVQTRAFPEGSNWAYSMPAFVPERKEVWYSEAYTGFYAVKLTNGAWPDATTAPPAPGAPPAAPPAAAPARPAGGSLAATGPLPWLSVAALGPLVLSIALIRRRTQLSAADPLH